MTNHEEHHEAQLQNKARFMLGYPFNLPPNEPARRGQRNLAGQADQYRQTNLTAGQQRQANLAAAQQRRTAARAAQRNLAAHRSLTDDQFRTELARIQQLCHQNRQDDTCPRECVVRQWRRGAPLGELNGMESFRRRMNGSP